MNDIQLTLIEGKNVCIESFSSPPFVLQQYAHVAYNENFPFITKINFPFS